MKTKYYILFCFILTTSFSLQAQNDRKVNRQGVKTYRQGDFSEAEVQFRKAGDINQESFEAGFNTGAALYGQEKYDETFKQYETLVEKTEDPETMAKVWHNMGNSLLESEKYEESIEAYKNGLRLNPRDQDTKYNLAYARRKLQDKEDQNQDQEQNQNQDQDQDQDQEQNQDQDRDQDQDQDQEQNQENQENQDQEQEQQDKAMEISREDAERMLNAIAQQEKDVKEKVDKKKAAAAKVKTEKDW